MTRTLAEGALWVAVFVLAVIIAVLAVPRSASGAIPGGSFTPPTGTHWTRISAPHGAVAPTPAPSTPGQRHEGQRQADLRPPARAMPAHIGPAIVGGRASWVRASLGSRYLAMRLPRGTAVSVCGALGCVRRTVNDYGPAARTRRIADLSRRDFARICGDPITLGTCEVVVTLRSIPAPATDAG